MKVKCVLQIFLPGSVTLHVRPRGVVHEGKLQKGTENESLAYLLKEKYFVINSKCHCIYRRIKGAINYNCHERRASCMSTLFQL